MVWRVDEPPALCNCLEILSSQGIHAGLLSRYVVGAGEADDSRKLLSLLNKLTPENSERIVGQVTGLNLSCPATMELVALQVDPYTYCVTGHGLPFSAQTACLS